MSDNKNIPEFISVSRPNAVPRERVVGERGRKDLPPGKKGGENMTPDRHKEHKQHTFDSFCKKVLKYEAYNGYREIGRRQMYEISFSELPEEAMEQLAVQGDPDAMSPFSFGSCCTLKKKALQAV